MSQLSSLLPIVQNPNITNWVQVNSSWVGMVRANGNDLEIMLHSGKSYRYKDAAVHFGAVVTAYSVGGMINALIKPHYPVI